MECHDEVVTLQVDTTCDGRYISLIPTDKVLTDNVETMSAMSKLRDHRDSIREGTV